MWPQSVQKWPYEDSILFTTFKPQGTQEIIAGVKNIQNDTILGPVIQS